MTINPTSIVAAGYKVITGQGTEIAWPYATQVYQKRVRNANGRTLYFLHVIQYNVLNKETYAAEARLYRSDTEFQMTTPFLDGKDIAWVESFFAQAFNALGCIEDQHNND